jgi:hypothetical protein
MPKMIHLYGDESHSNEIVTYAFIIAPEKHLQSIEDAIANVKIRHKPPPKTGVHCRRIFNEHARNKTEFKEFSTEELFIFLDELMTESFLAGARGWVGYLDSKTIPSKLLCNSSNDRNIETWDVTNLKNKMLFCYQAACAPLTHIIAPTKIEAFVDGDKTKIPYFDKKRQVDYLKSFFPVEHNNLAFTPRILHADKPLILDLADVLAYAAAHGLSKTISSYTKNYVSIVNAIAPGYSEVIFEPPTGGPICKIRAYDSGDRIKSYINDFL